MIALTALRACHHYALFALANAAANDAQVLLQCKLIGSVGHNDRVNVVLGVLARGARLGRA